MNINEHNTDDIYNKKTQKILLQKFLTNQL